MGASFISQALPVGELKGHRTVGEATARLASQRGMPYHGTLCLVYKVGWAWPGSPIVAQGLSGHWSASGKRMQCASLICFPPLPLDFFPLVFSLPFVLDVINIFLCFSFYFNFWGFLLSTLKFYIPF